MVVIWGDDQYENFKEDVIPPFTVCAYGDIEVHPWAHARESAAMGTKPNVWGEGAEFSFTLRGRPDIARALATGLLNCYGRRVVSAKGFLTIDFDPPSPSPGRFMEMGAAAARVLRASPWRVALVASSSWSHAFLCDWTHRLRPDTEADRRLYEALLRHDFALGLGKSLAEVEAAGQQEVLNWFALMGAVETLGARLEWSQWVETHIFNSNKVFALYGPA